MAKGYRIAISVEDEWIFNQDVSAAELVPVLAVLEPLSVRGSIGLSAANSISYDRFRANQVVKELWDGIYCLVLADRLRRHQKTEVPHADPGPSHPPGASVEIVCRCHDLSVPTGHLVCAVR